MSTTLFWLDLETTGLDPQECVILEAFGFCTDLDLNPVSPGNRSGPIPPEDLHSYVVHYDETPPMNEWCTTTHTESGLLEELPVSGMSLRDVEDALIQQLPNGEANLVLAGNSVHFDRSFLNVHMPSLASMLSHRTFDVRTLQYAAQWTSSILMPPASAKHRAKPDILHSYEVAKAVRKHLAYGGRMPFNPYKLRWKDKNGHVEHGRILAMDDGDGVHWICMGELTVKGYMSNAYLVAEDEA